LRAFFEEEKKCILTLNIGCVEKFLVVMVRSSEKDGWIRTMVDKAQIMNQLAQVVDPEVGVPITEMDLVDEVSIEEGKVGIAFHLTAPFCPPMFALEIAQDIKRRVSSLEGVREVKVQMKNHFMAEEINRRVNAPPATHG
jgi:metal-sulfur cluster biosynthetic enzyme